MKKSLLVFILSTIKLCINAQIVVEEAKPKATLPETPALLYHLIPRIIHHPHREK